MKSIKQQTQDWATIKRISKAVEKSRKKELAKVTKRLNDFSYDELSLLGRLLGA